MCLCALCIYAHLRNLETFYTWGNLEFLARHRLILCYFNYLTSVSVRESASWSVGRQCLLAYFFLLEVIHQYVALQVSDVCVAVLRCPSRTILLFGLSSASLEGLQTKWRFIVNMSADVRARANSVSECFILEHSLRIYFGGCWLWNMFQRT